MQITARDEEIGNIRKLPPESLASPNFVRFLTVGTVLLAAALGALSTVNTWIVSVAVIGILLSVVLFHRTYLIVPVTMIAAFMVTPVFVPKWIGIGPFQMQAYEPLLILAFVWALGRPILPATKRTAMLLSAWLGIGLIGAFLASTAFNHVLGDIRQPIALLMAMVVAAAAVEAGLSSVVVRTSRWILWISASFTIAASAFSLKISGRSEGAALFDRDSAAATRILTSSTFFALAVLCICLGLVVLGRKKFLSLWSFWLPTLPILFLAFSRNHLIAIAVAILVSAIVSKSNGRVAEFGYKAALTALLAGVMLLGLLAVGDGIPGASWMTTQVGGYAERVVGGISDEALAKDPSALYREAENQALISSFLQDPIIGGGFGHAYRVPTGDPGTFMHDKAPWYAHNFYLWSGVKTGAFGLLLLGLAIIPALWCALFRSRSGAAMALGATLAGFLFVAIYAPVPIDSPGSMLVGIIIGAMIGESYVSRSQTGSLLVPTCEAKLEMAGSKGD